MPWGGNLPTPFEKKSFSFNVFSYCYWLLLTKVAGGQHFSVIFSFFFAVCPRNPTAVSGVPRNKTPVCYMCIGAARAALYYYGK